MFSETGLVEIVDNDPSNKGKELTKKPRKHTQARMAANKMVASNKAMTAYWGGQVSEMMEIVPSCEVHCLTLMATQ